jgi:hypothetical protein
MLKVAVVYSVIQLLFIFDADINQITDMTKANSSVHIVTANSALQLATSFPNIAADFL